MKLEYNWESMWCSEWLALIIIIWFIMWCVILWIILLPYRLKCATMQVSEMPWYCIYLLQNK